MKPDFSIDWFSNNITKWTKYLSAFKSKPVNFLEIGSFEGKSSLWLLENILTHKQSTLTCIDNFSYKNTEQKLKNNLKDYKDKITILKGDSNIMLKTLKNNTYDFIYIDANRHSQNVLEDAILSFMLLKPNGIIIFDDYTNNKEHDNNCPKPGIDAFLNIYANNIKVLHSRWQVILMKREKSLSRKPCYSEFYTEPSKNLWWWK